MRSPILTAFALSALVLATATCNDVLGFHEGKPYPDAGENSDGSSADRSVSETDSEADRRETGPLDDRATPPGDAPDGGRESEAGTDACSPELSSDPLNCG